MYLNRRLQNYEVLKVEDNLVIVSIGISWGGMNRKVVVHSAYNRPPISHTTTRIPDQLEKAMQAGEAYRDSE